MSRQMNVSDTERVVSGLGGGALMLWGIARRSLGGALLALLGSALAYRGATGRCPVYEGLGIDTAGADHRDRDAVVEEASEESFPASDAPAWTPTTSVGELRR